MSSRSFLLLQGVASPFFRELGVALKKQGYQVVRINFCGGDWLISRPSLQRSNKVERLNFRRPLKQLPSFLEKLYNRHAITDIVLFGDMRPVHRAAIQLARTQHVSIHVFEEGYLRPGWITLERNGVNANSDLLAKDPRWYLDYARKHTPEIDALAEPVETGKQLTPRAIHDIRYHLASFLLRPLFPFYRTHRPDKPLTEYLGWIRRFPLIALFHKKKAVESIRQLLASSKPFYLLPLQLNADAQIVAHSPVNSVAEVIETCIASFSRNAPENSLLVIKNHPLDTGLIDYPQVIRRAVNFNDLDPARVIYLETGDLQALLDKATGTVLVNSTVGLASLASGCPTQVLGTAIYNLTGLTSDATLDQFWSTALSGGANPDPVLFDAFQKTLLLTNQVNGDFYTRKGIKMAVEGSLLKLIGASEKDSQSKSVQATSVHSNRYPA